MLRRILLATILALAILWIAGAVNQHLNNVTYNKCKIADQRYKYDAPMKCEEVLDYL